MAFVLILLILSRAFLAIPVNAVSTKSTTCTLDCQHGSCMKGSANFSDHPKDGSAPLSFHAHNNKNGQYCECTNGFTGLLCDHDYIMCNAGKHACYHGGKCMSETIHGLSGSASFVCDCRDAIHPSANSKYVGRFCEHEVKVEIDTCSSSVFCVNNGTCVSSIQKGGKPHCSCPPGETGRHCEYHTKYVPDCKLNCKNEGFCVVGLRNKTMAENIDRSITTVNENFQYCQCRDGFYGNNCEREYSECEDNLCLFGSQCIELTNEAGFVERHCNCTAAESTSASYAGKSCEHVSTSFCAKEATLNGIPFCVNEGTCLSTTNEVVQCNCSSSFRGPHCEYPVTMPELAQYENCNLTCANGECRKGEKNYGSLTQFANINHLINMTHAPTSYEFCECPEGYVGLYCEHKVVICGAGEHACFFGSQCIQKSGNAFECDCGPADKFTVGEYCQHSMDSATKVCKEDLSVQSFCVNGGTCVDSSTTPGHAGCICTRDFQGDRCEIRTSTIPQETASSREISGNANETSYVKAVIVGCMSALATGSIFLLSLVFINRRAETRGIDRRCEDALGSDPVDSTGPTSAEASGELI